MKPLNENYTAKSLNQLLGDSSLIGKKIPDEPTQEEWDDHMIDHTPYRG